MREFASAYTRAMSIGVSLAITLVASAQSILIPGDLAYVSRTYGSVIALAGDAPLIVSGPDLSLVNRPVRGQGPSLANSAHTSLLALSPTRLLAHPATNLQWGVYSIDVATGDRALLVGTNGPLWSTGGDMLAWDADTVLAIADDYPAGPLSNGRLLRYRFSTGETTVVSGGLVGDGFVMCRPRAIAKLNDNEVAIVEFAIIGGKPGALIYRIDLVNGHRSVVTTLNDLPADRFEVSGGVLSSVSAPVPARGDGPVFNNVHRAIAFLDGRLFVAGTVAVGSQFSSGICEVDLATGNRTHLGGTMLVGGIPTTVPYGDGSTTIFPDGPVSLLPSGDHALVFAATFGPNRIWEFDTQTRVLSIRANLDGGLAPPTNADVRISGLALVPPPCVFEHCPPICDSIDFNNDTSLFDPQDIEAFLSVYSEGPCVPTTATCGDIDFNNDTSLFDPCDIGSFLVMYSEGPCTPCGQ